MHFFPPVVGQERSTHDFLNLTALSEKQKNSEFSSLLTSYMDDSEMLEKDVLATYDQPWEDPESLNGQAMESPLHQELNTEAQLSTNHECLEDESDRTCSQTVISAASPENQNEHIQKLKTDIVMASSDSSTKGAILGHDEVRNEQLDRLVLNLERILTAMDSKNGHDAGSVQIKSQLVQLQDLAQKITQAEPEKKLALQQELATKVQELTKVMGSAHTSTQSENSDLKTINQKQTLAPVIHELHALVKTLEGDKALDAHSNTKDANSKVNPKQKTMSSTEGISSKASQNKQASINIKEDLKRSAVFEVEQKDVSRAHKEIQTEEKRQAQGQSSQDNTVTNSSSSQKHGLTTQHTRDTGKDLPGAQRAGTDHENETSLNPHIQSRNPKNENTTGKSSTQNKNNQNFERPKDGLLSHTDSSTGNTGKTSSQSFIETTLAGQHAGEQNSTTGKSTSAPTPQARHAEVLRQVENGAFRNLGQGNKQLVIRLDPPDLGRVSVILQVRGKELQAVLRTTHQETSHALQDQLGQLRTQLEDQGLRVSRLEVQTQLADSQTESGWHGTEQHNRFQEHREMSLTSNRLRSLGRSKELVQDVQSTPHRENISPHGLDIFA